MVLKLYNTLTKRKEEFKPLEGNVVKIYTCGPTVYDYAHIGNFRAYIFADILRRYLKYFKGYKVIHVMNITDIDDKIIKAVNEQNVDLEEYVSKYIKIFFEDIKTLNLETFEYYPRVTKHIKDIVEAIKKLLEKGYAYKSKDGSIYYDISKFKDYGKLSGIRNVKKKSRISHDSYSKEEIGDFALWKAYKPEDGKVYFETEFGRGRPGWHIECSVLAMKYLGETIDIHTGGVDLIFPHHENEIAQSEAITGKQFVRFWLHNEHLIVEGRKMSKSLGNIITLRDLLNKGYSWRAIRFLLLSTHYRRQLNFTYDALKSAENTVRNLANFVIKLKFLNVNGKYDEELKKKLEEARRKFEEYMDDDLNISEALASLFEFISFVNKKINKGEVSRKNLDEVLEFILKVDKVLGLKLDEFLNVDENVIKLIKEREEARKRKDYKRADEIRNYIREKYGLILEDTKYGTIWRVEKI